MFTTEIEYTDLFGQKQKEKFYFSLSEVDLFDMQLSVNGGLSEYAEKIINENDSQKIWKLFEKLVLNSYGEKSVDGKSFIKFDEEGRRLSNKFKQTIAYNELMVKIVSNADFAAEFFNHLAPKRIMDKVDKTDFNGKEIFKEVLSDATASIGGEEDAKTDDTETGTV